MLAVLINGTTVNDAAHAISVEDRGLSYGDGLFETMRLHAGAVCFLNKHLARLQLGCQRLGIAMPQEVLLRQDIELLTRDHQEGIVKLIVTRGAGGRGYRAATAIDATRIAMLYPVTNGNQRDGITVRWCATRLGRNPLLAGIKHLNRLEQVLAQNEWHDQRVAEGLLLDTEGELICATASNVFIVTDGVLSTPDLRFSGIRGVMRAAVVAAAGKENLVVEERALWPEDFLNASEVFLTNAVRGIRPVIALDERRWSVGPITTRLTVALKL